MTNGGKNDDEELLGEEDDRVGGDQPPSMDTVKLVGAYHQVKPFEAMSQ